MATVRDAMTTNPKTLASSATVVDAAKLMKAEDAGIVPIVDGDRVTGVVTDRDIAIKVVAEGKDPASIVKAKGLVQVSDPSVIEDAMRRVMAASPKNVEEYRAGKEKLFGFFIGQMMKETQGKANPGLVNDIVKAFLKGEKQ